MSGETTPRTVAGGAYRYRAAIFDMDGVVTDTAALHAAAAWKQLFDDLLAARAGTDGVDARPFDADADYRRYVDGRSREDGVAAFLMARRAPSTSCCGATPASPCTTTCCGSTRCCPTGSSGSPLICSTGASR